MLLGEVLHALLPEVDGTKNLGVLGFETVYDAVQAGADLVLHVWRWLDGSLQLTCPRLKSFGLGRLPPVAVDYGIAEQAIEPAHSGLVRIEVVLMLKGAKIRGLQNVFGESRVGDAALDEGEELFALRQKLIEVCVGHKDARREV